jgi:hypothetical protein
VLRNPVGLREKIRIAFLVFDVLPFDVFSAVKFRKIRTTKNGEADSSRKKV